MMRLGCRPLKRKFLACKQQERYNQFTISCKPLQDELEHCTKLLNYVKSSYSTNKLE